MRKAPSWRRRQALGGVARLPVPKARANLTFVPAAAGGGQSIIGQACRAGNIADANSTHSPARSASHPYRVWSATSLRQCLGFCQADSSCTGVEYRPDDDICDVWSQPIGTTEAAEGFVCLRAVPSQPSHRTSSNLTCLDWVSGNRLWEGGCSSIHHEHLCLTSRAPLPDREDVSGGHDREQSEEGQPCVWCGGAPCLHVSHALCEARTHVFIDGDMKYDNMISLGNFTVASCVESEEGGLISAFESSRDRLAAHSEDGDWQAHVGSMSNLTELDAAGASTASSPGLWKLFHPPFVWMTLGFMVLFLVHGVMLFRWWREGCGRIKEEGGEQRAERSGDGGDGAAAPRNSRSRRTRAVSLSSPQPTEVQRPEVQPQLRPPILPMFQFPFAAVQQPCYQPLLGLGTVPSMPSFPSCDIGVMAHQDRNSRALQSCPSHFEQQAWSQAQAQHQWQLQQMQLQTPPPTPLPSHRMVQPQHQPDPWQYTQVQQSQQQAEFLQQRQPQEDHRTLADHIFDALDVNGDGMLTLAEFRQGLGFA